MYRTLRRNHGWCSVVTNSSDHLLLQIKASFGDVIVGAITQLGCVRNTQLGCDYFILFVRFTHVLYNTNLIRFKRKLTKHLLNKTNKRKPSETHSYITRNRQNQEIILVPDWLITSRVTSITSSDCFFTCVGRFLYVTQLCKITSIESHIIMIVIHTSKNLNIVRSAD
eukprot:sb/3472357/